MMKLAPFYVECDVQDGGCTTKYPGDLDHCPKCGGATSLMSIPAWLPVDVYVYDIETFPNIFTFACIHPVTRTKWLFEISDRVNQFDQLKLFLSQLVQCKGKMVGYNNVNFDYPVIHYIMVTQVLTMNVEMIYDKAMSIINSPRGDNSHVIWDNNQLIQQIDLYKIYHFDRAEKATSLKALEFFMRMKNIRDLPYPVGTILTTDVMKDELISYNWHDVIATIMFWVRSLDLIEFRNEMTIKYGKNFTNFSNTKLGMTIFRTKLEEAGIACYDNGQPLQTIRSEVKLVECIPNYIQFEHPEFKRILEVFKSKTLVGTNVKALFKDFNCTIDGITYVFGAGGQHASRTGLFQADDTWCIVDVDVEGMYPRVIEKNGYFPHHLGRGFSPIFGGMIEERIIIGKKTRLGMGLKEAANATYGNLGMGYSFVYDLKTLLSTTLTGQLVLSMLVDQVIKIDGAMILQTNTDGFTIRMKRADLGFLTQLVTWWEDITQLKMEYNYYSRMWLKNVNSYIAEDEKTGSLKRKKDYNYNLEYHKDASALVVPKAIEYYLVHGQDIKDFITNHKDPYDFCLRAKVPRSNELVMRWGELGDQKLQKITRYFVAKQGGSLVKIAPARGIPGQFKRANSLTDFFYDQVMAEIGPGIWDARIHTKNKSVYGTNVETGISAGWKTIDCSNMDDFDWKNVNYDYYIAEAEKLII